MVGTDMVPAANLEAKDLGPLLPKQSPFGNKHGQLGMDFDKSDWIHLPNFKYPQWVKEVSARINREFMRADKQASSAHSHIRFVRASPTEFKEYVDFFQREFPVFAKGDPEKYHGRFEVPE